MSIGDKLPPDYRFTEEDLDAAWKFWCRDWDGEELSDDEHEFTNCAFEAERFQHLKGFWPTLGQVLDFSKTDRAQQ